MAWAKDKAKLKRLRRHYGMTVIQAACHLGISRQRWFNYESNRNRPLTREVMVLLCRKFNVSADWLLLDEEPMLRWKRTMSRKP